MGKEMKLLGKITFAEYGAIRDYPFMMGLQLGFSLSDGSAVMDGGKHAVNMNPDCKWKTMNREVAITKSVEYVYDILKAAKATYVSDLIGKPVEVELENYTFKDFRILTEVL